MKILLTGSFGNVGESTLNELLSRGYEIRCFDKKSRHNKKIYKLMRDKGNFETIWGDIRNQEDVDKIVEGVDYVIHLAAVIPPKADEKPDYANEVNAGGMRNLVEAVEKLEKKPKIIFTSSLAIYGAKMHLPPPRTVDDEIKPLAHDLYAFQKWEMEKILQASTLDWIILRLTAVPDIHMPMKIPALMFEVPFEQRLEFVHSWDVALACVNAIETDLNHSIMHVAGGEKCRMTGGDYITRLLSAFGVGPIPKECFLLPENDEEWFHTDWLYTEDSQELLKYQRYTLEDFAVEFEQRIKIRKKLISYVSPLAKLFLIIRSPYYRKNKKKARTA
ncbi:MAG: NAD(P)-dependent oxidoreductase [Candidatus Heimdallarchaeota archaeon]|nr:NAD(P)-dependent oxidoreductase [Candidatus Heimdallarchaeota archaeon]MCK4955686.1 NAD(P)-dependent oxidoreductase [Candidatus Heimdallarchaeota archaeon]